jgi:hypothetical protein
MIHPILVEEIMIKSKIEAPRTSGINFGLAFADHLSVKVKGDVFATLTYPDGREEVVIDKSNIYTLDGGVFAAILFSNNAGAGNARFVNMLAVGTGASGSQQSPDIPDYQQRRLNTPLYKKTFSSVVFRKADGSLSVDGNSNPIPTNIVDFTTTFESAEAVGALTEMGLISSVNELPTNFVSNPNNFPQDRDVSEVVTDYDTLINYLTFPVINKPNGAILAITWRLTF